MTSNLTPATGELTAQEMFESLTAGELLVIQQVFGTSFNDLDDPYLERSALAFIQERRADPTAKVGILKQRAMKLTVRELKDGGDYFAEYKPEALPEDPVGEQGKDDWPVNEPPTS